MGKIPEFTRTVLPQRAQYGLADAARTAGEREAAQYRQNAQNIQETRQASRQLEATVTDYQLREAQARNATWVNENVIQYKKDMTDAADSFRRERAGNPDNFHKDFDKEMTKLGAQYMKQAPSQAARESISETMASMRASAYDDNLSWERGRKAELFAESIERSTDNLRVMALRRGQNGQGIDDLLRDADASAVAGSTIVSGPEKVAAIRRTVRRGVIADYIEGLAEKDPKAAQDLIKSGKYDKELEADEIQRLDGVAEAEMKKRQAKAREELSGELSDIQTATKLGLKLPKDNLQNLIAKTQAAGMDKEAEGLRDYMALQDDVSAFAVKSISDQKQIIEDLKASVEGGNTADVKKYAAFANVFQTKAETVKKEPYSYYAAHDIIRSPQPIDFADPQRMAHELDQRRISVQQVKDLDGLTMPLFTPEEITQLKGVYEQSQPREVSALLASLSSAMSPQESAALAGAMAPQSKTLAVAIANGDQQVGEMIVMGAKAKGEVSAADVRSVVNEQIGGAVIDPGTLEPIHDAVYAYYKQASLMAGDTGDVVDETRLQKSVEAVMGPVLDIDTKFGWGGASKVLSFRDTDTKAWVDEDRLNDILTGITDDQLKELGGMPESPSGGQWSADKILKSSRFVSAGDGVYAAIVDGLGFVSNKDGSPYLFDARKLEALQRRGK